MFKKIVWKYRRVIVAVVGVLAIGGIVTGVALSNKGDDQPNKEGVSINAGNDNKDNQADFNGQEGQETTTQPVETPTTNEVIDTIIEQKGSILGEWTTSQGDTFNCNSVDGGMYATVSLLDTGKYYTGSVDTDNTTYIKISDDNSGATISIDIVQMASASELGLSDGQIYMLLKFSGEESERLFKRANEDYLHEDIKDILESNGEGVSGGSPDDEQYVPDNPEDQLVDIEGEPVEEVVEGEPVE